MSVEYSWFIINHDIKWIPFSRVRRYVKNEELINHDVYVEVVRVTHNRIAYMDCNAIWVSADRFGWSVRIDELYDLASVL